VDLESQPVKVALPNGATIYVAATMLGGEQDVAFERLSFQAVSEAIEGISSSIVQALKKVKPSKASVELGLEIAVDEGALTALLVKAGGKANLKVTLEWGAQEEAAAAKVDT